MPKLTDTQLIILSAAAQRKDGAVLPLPKSLEGREGAATRALKSLLKKNFLAERPAAPESAPWRETEDGERVTLVITDAGLQAIGVEPGDGTEQQAPMAKVQPKARRKGTTPKGAAAKSKAKPSPSTVARPGTKQALLVDLLKRKDGATIEEIVAATGWQAHSVRGAISGTLKKKLGLTVTSGPVEGRGWVYRIAERG